MANTTATIVKNASEPRDRPKRISLVAYLLVAPPVLIMALLIFYPAIEAVIKTFFVTDEKSGQVSFTLLNYSKFFDSAILRANGWHTVVAVSDGSAGAT